MPSIELQRGNRRFDGHGWVQPSKKLHPKVHRVLTSWRTGCINSLVSCPAGYDNSARVRLFPHASLDSHSWLSVLPGKGCSRKEPFAFQGRCFVVVNARAVARRGRKAGLQRSTHGQTSSRRNSETMPGSAPVATTKHRPASSKGHSGRSLTKHWACMGCTHRTPAATTNRDSRPGLGKGTGTRFVRDGVTGSARSEATCPTVALGLESHRSRHPDGEGDSHITLPQA